MSCAKCARALLIDMIVPPPPLSYVVPKEVGKVGQQSPDFLKVRASALQPLRSCRCLHAYH